MVTTSSVGGTTSIDGLVSGLDTTSLINSIMATERLPEQQLTKAKTASQTMVSTLQNLNSLMTTMQTAAKNFIPDTITKASTWTSTVATSSSPALATASTSDSATAGSTTFTVLSVASAGAAVSAGTVSSLTTPIASGPFVLTKGASALGLSGVDAGASLSTGAHSIQVTQSSAGASLTGSSAVSGFGAVPPAVTIDGSNNTIVYYLDGSSIPTTVTLNAGTYSPVQLAAEIARASGGAVSATTDATGHLQITTTDEGSDASIQLDGSGTANATLGLTDTTTVSHGTDGMVSLDGGPATTVTNAAAGQTLTLTNAAGGSVVATLAGGLRAGTATSTSVSVAAGATLNDVVKALNSSGAGVTANAVQVGSSAYRLQVSSTTTGAASNITLSSGAFPSGQSALGGMQELYAGTDTVLQVGTGVGAYRVTSSTTAVTGLIPGVTVTAVAADPNTPVTVGVTSDTSTMASTMSALVDAVNGVLSNIATQSKYDTTSNTGGPLVGDSMTRDLVSQLTSAIIGTSSSTAAMAGVAVTRDGTVSFDQTAFLQAYSADPSGVTAAMTQMAKALSDTADQYSSPIDGAITQRINDENNNISDYTQRISDFEDRMTLVQQNLQTQYAALETMLGDLKSQSDWLTAQISSLPSTSSSSK